MSFTQSLPFADALRVGYGRYLIAAEAGTMFYLGDTNTAMSQINVVEAGRFYLDGPFYFKKLVGVVHLTRLPEKTQLSEGGFAMPGAPDNSGKGGQDMGS